MNSLFLLLGIILVMITLPGTLELLFLTLGALFFRSKNPKPKIQFSRAVIVIPAHNERSTIGRLLQNLQERPCNFDCVVIADNCTDDTASIASNYEVRTIVRNDPKNLGKNFAIQYGLQILEPENYEYVYFIDADSQIEKGFFENTLAVLQEGADAVQGYYGVLNPSQSFRTRLMNIAMLAFNFLRPRGREYWNLSVGILGNGFALSKKTLQDVPFEVSSIVEDLSYHIQLVSAGKQVRFVEKARILAEMPIRAKGIKSQRKRWEGGRFKTIARETPKILRAIIRGEWRLIEPLFELWLLPLSLHGILLLILLLFFSEKVFLYYTLFASSVLIIHVFSALKMGKASAKDYLCLLLVPAYAIWKLGVYIQIFFSKNLLWIRTERNEDVR